MRYYFAFSLFILIATGCSNQKMAPSGRTLGFVKTTEGVNHIYLMELDNNNLGVKMRRLSNNSESEDYPSWSPNGKQIAYQLSKDGSGIHISNDDGTGQKRLSPIPGFDVNPSFSPDGKKIIYVRVLDPIVPNVMPRTEIRVMALDGSDDHAILSEGNFSVEPRWSVKNKIVFMGFSNGSLQVYTMDADGSNRVQLTKEGNNGDPSWSNNGAKISFGSDREGNNKLNIFTMDADGSNIMQVTHFDTPYESGDTSWSPDGNKIAFEWDIDGKKQSDPMAYAEVWIVNADGTGAQSTSIPCSGVGCAPRWKP